ncbi:hypothetical protein [Winogradskya consettensis]|nr:hypothetical protein [Actinoplanes consettensis]
MPLFPALRFAVPVLAAAAGLLGGCSGSTSDSSTGSPKVATLQSADVAASPSTSVDDQRPLVRLDASDEEREDSIKLWAACVFKLGGPGYEDPRSLIWHRGEAKAEKIRVACQSKEPETYEQRQQRTDIAAFRDNQREWYKCAKEAGYKLTPPEEDGQFGLTEVGPNGDFGSAKMEDCRKEAFKE